MKELFSMSLEEVINLSASSEPTPGGGSVSAICAAFAGSMAAMVCNLTIGKKKYKEVEERVMDLRDETMHLISEFKNLVYEDMAEFEKLMDTYKLPKSTPEEKEKRDAALEEALKGATETPLKVARGCLRLLRIVDELAPIGNKMAISDAGVAAYLAEGSLRAVLLNVDINIPSIRDKEYVRNVMKEKEQLIAEAQELKERSLGVVMERMG
ncbi:MAG TPA: cyclodeaminase/cyclohydrolase family protein [Bacillota bacterium]|nr:cyclodeaminase/cyclohydrolase family protein [Bacillota bacterium]HOL12202.1 cyclodeaminase/cyclohydrolase family protein [Bacillota bacterium]HOQ02240.1 cyclodeaminase/cyclohydrolase family protein [Bacillota bacterium]HPP61179.1 cyclodeaminase/cyclohydrolase family protein [Bacillota bacterium]HPV12677.1 cyclodeaminase/cyclohydrolase family protein [Bacillota bacterium]